MYKVVQTGANNQFGGLNEGCIRVAYHPSISLAVKNPERPPTNSGNEIETINLNQLNFMV